MSREFPAVKPYDDLKNDLGSITKRWREGYIKKLFVDEVGGALATLIDALATKAEVATVEGQIANATAPNYYSEDIPWTADTEDNRTTLASPNILWLNIDGKGHKLTEQITIDIANPSVWDTKATLWTTETAYEVGDNVYAIDGTDTYMYTCITAGTSSTLIPTWPTTIDATYNDGSVVWKCVYNYSAPANRAGKDFYIYALYNAEGLEPSFIISANGIAPENVDVAFRKIGGFHCEYADIGTDTYGADSHKLYGYLQGDILPMSVWDCWHRPVGEPEGYVYDPDSNIWVSIYGLSWTGSYSNDPEDLRCVSRAGAEWADGTSTEKFHCLKFEQVLARQHQRLLWRREFVTASLGSNQGTNIAGSTDPGTTGGHKDTAGKRMVSWIGCEDMCGDHWQWGADTGSASTSGSYGAGYTTDDKYVGGQIYGTEYRPILGGSWVDAAVCGSRAAYWFSGSLALYAAYGSRGASEPLHNEAGAIHSNA